MEKEVIQIALSWEAVAVFIVIFGAMLSGAFWIGALQKEKVGRDQCENFRKNCFVNVDSMFNKIWNRIDEMAKTISETSVSTARIEGKINKNNGD